MKMVGDVYWSEAFRDYVVFAETTVRDAILTVKRVVIDWLEDGEPYQLEAHSTDDGVHYNGSFGISRPDDDGRMRLSRYDSKDGSTILVGDWVSNGEGFVLFRLRPLEAPRKGRHRRR